MEIAIGKLAALLQTSVEAATQLYPILRTQYIWWELFESIQVWSGIGLIAAVPTGVFFLFVEDVQEYIRSKVVLYSTVLVVGFFTVMFGAKIGQLLIAPDLCLLIKLLG